MQAHSLTDLLGIQGFHVAAVERLGSSPGSSRVRIHLDRTGEGYVCGGCGARVCSLLDNDGRFCIEIGPPMMPFGVP